jgi:hypothetical protein
VHTVAGPATLGGASATHAAIYGVINRATPGAVSLAVADLGAAALDTDDAYVVAVRGADTKLYFSNGSVFSDTDVKEFGALDAATDRDDIVSADGLGPQTVGFTYILATDQLAVYVGGILQKLGVHYVETDTTTVTFQAGYIPSIGELITFLNVAGGQGPAGTNGLQDSYLVGGTIDVTPGTPVQVDATAGSGTTPALQVGNAGEIGALAAFQVLRDGTVTHNGDAIRDAAGDTWVREVDAGTNDILLHSSDVGLEFGVKIAKDGAGIEFGKMPAGGPWAPQEGGGFLRWVVFTGTLDVGNGEEIISGLDPTKVLGATLSVLDSGGNADLLTRNIVPTSSDIYVIMEADGDIYISGSTTTYTATPVGARYQNRAFKLVIFLSN